MTKGFLDKLWAEQVENARAGLHRHSCAASSYDKMMIAINAELHELRRKVQLVEQMRPDDALVHIGRTQGDPVARRLIGAGWKYVSGDGYPIGEGATPWDALNVKEAGE
jgi:hypothetical protein